MEVVGGYLRMGEDDFRSRKVDKWLGQEEYAGKRGLGMSTSLLLGRCLKYVDIRGYFKKFAL